MKTLKYFITTALVTLLLINLQSCKLDEQLRDTTTASQIKTEADVTNLVNGTYAVLDDANGFKFSGMFLTFLCADDLYSTLDGNFSKYSQKQYTAATTEVGDFMTYFYDVIRGANNIISVLDKLDLTPAYEQRVYAEARFLRAFSYFYLVRLYGGVPLRTVAVDEKSDLYLPRNTVDEVYAQIFKDFQFASANLPLQSAINAAELGRASKGAAQALLSKAYLTYASYLDQNGKTGTASYQQASLYADSVINSGQYTLLANFADLFNVKKEVASYSEVIFGVRYTVDNVRTALGSSGSEFAFRTLPKNIGGLTGSEPDGTGNGEIQVHPYFVDYYTSGEYKNDYRATATYLAGGVNPANGKYIAIYPNIPPNTAAGNNANVYLAKYIDPDGADQRNHGNDLYIIRLAEVYLIKAEAENELNAAPTPAAYAAFNMLRARARKADGVARTTPADLAPGLTKAQFRVKLIDERDAEFIGEGMRWFDLVRMKHPTDPTKTMFDYQFDLLKTKPFESTVAPLTPRYNAPTKAWIGGGTVYGPALQVQQKHKLFPIPDNERTINPNFGAQNPGW